MKNNKKLQKQISETKAQLAALREAAAQKPFGLAQLMESELDKAELVLAVKGISDELQQIAEKVAKIEAEEIMPIIDALKASFGPELAQGFNSVASDNLRNLVEAIKTSKDAIGNEILRLEAAADGKEFNDMAMAPPAAPEAPAAAPEAPMGDDLGMEADPLADAGAAAPEAAITDADLDMDDTASYDDPAAGRAKKESAEFRHANNPDKFVFEAVVSRIRSGAKGPEAARLVAENLGLELSDVVEIISEASTKKADLDEAAKKFVITVKGKKHTFDTLSDAKDKADEIHKNTGVIVGIEQE